MTKKDLDHTKHSYSSWAPFKEMTAKTGGAEGLLRAILEASESVIFVKDLDGRYVLANPAFSRILHRPVAEIIGKTDTELFANEEAEVLRVGDARVLNTGETLHSVDRLTVYGEERVFLATKVPLRDNVGKIIGVSGFATEITEEIKTQDQLAHLNRVLRAIRSVNQLITKAKDRDQLLHSACELLIKNRGYYSAWIVLLDGNRGFSGFYHAGLADIAPVLEERLRQGNLPECVQRALAQPSVVAIEDTSAECGDCPLLGKAPDQREVTARLEHDGTVYGVLSVSLPRGYVGLAEEQSLVKEVAGDLAFALHELSAEEARRQAQAALAESEARFRAIVENAHAGILMVDEDYHIVYVNEAFTRLFGWAREDVIGHDFRDFLDDESRDLVADRYQRRQRGEEVPPRYEFNVMHKDGAKRRIEISATVIRDSAGHVRTIAQLLDITERVRLQERLMAIYSLGQKLTLSNDEKEIAIATVEAAREILGMGDCSLYRLDTEKNALVLQACLRAIKPELHELPLDTDRGVMAAVVRTGEAIYLPDVSQDARYIVGREENRSEFCIPLKVEGRTIGVLNAESPELNAFTPDQRRLLSFLTDTAAVALESARLYRSLVHSEQELKESYEKLQRTMDGVIEALTAAVELRDPYTAGHQLRVMQLAVAIAEEMNLPSDRINGIRYAALVHDIGKIAVPAEILAKPTKLTASEFAIIKSHPQQAYDILKEIDFPWPIADIVLQHHERLDGSGYPQGLKDDEILLEARILAVADVVEAMSSHRPYRPALGTDKALAEIKKNKGRLYDPAAVDACVSVFDKGFSFE